MSKAGVGFYAAMGAVLLLVWGWMAVGLWPQKWIEWRAEMGDRAAREYLAQQGWVTSNSNMVSRWTMPEDEFSEHEMLFMWPDSRQIMKKLLQAQGKKTPLLDVIDNK